MGNGGAKGYSEDLAYIHHEGHAAFARGAAPALLTLFKAHGIAGGLIVDLGSGSGVLAKILTRAGYDVLGIDVSPAMVRLARIHASRARFRVASMFSASIPPCSAVISVGECVNYEFDRGDGSRDGGHSIRLENLYRSVHDSLPAGGLFVFDFLEPSRGAPRMSSAQRVGSDWAVMAQTVEDADTGLLTRSITSYRKRGALYRRTDEIHRLRLIRRSAVARQLRHAGFRVTTCDAYGSFRVGKDHAVAIARRTSR